MTNSNQRVAKKIVQTAGRDRLGDFAPDFARYNDYRQTSLPYGFRGLKIKPRLICDGQGSERSGTDS